jgi:hypothetical protein
MDDFLDHSLPAQVISATIGGQLALVVIILIAYKLGKEKGDLWQTYLIVGLGALVGWATGILASPLDTEEGARFVKFGQLITAFSSGYLISKLDRFLEQSLFKDKQPVSENWIYVAFFCAAFLSTLIPSYVNRSYFHSLRDTGVQVELKDESARLIRPVPDAMAD